MTPSGQDLIGRAAELAVCRKLLAMTPPWVAVVEGPAGIGKTALWRSALSYASATGWRVLSTRPGEREKDLTDRALVELFDDITEDELSLLPAPQAGSIRELLRRQPVGRPERLTLIFLIRSLIEALTRSGGRALLAIDDAQWIDAESGDVLGSLVTAARPPPTGVLFTVRSGGANGLPFEPARLPVPPTTIRLSALDLDVCSELVRARFGGGWSQTLLRAIWDSAAGNPLTVLELARAMADRRAEPVPTSLPLAGLGDALEHHLRSLPAAGQQAAAVASALSRPTRAEVTQIAQACSLTVDLDVAVDDGVLVAAGPGGGIAFAHPLLRAAAYARIRETQRRAIHAAAATACDSPSERAWHLAETAEGPDETIAAALEAVVRQLIAAGAPLTAVPLAERTLALTPHSSTHNLFLRQLLLIDALESAGDLARTRSIIPDLMDLAVTADDRAQALWRRAMSFGNERTLQDAVDDIHAALCELDWTTETVSAVPAAARPLAITLLMEYAAIVGKSRAQVAAALPLAEQAIALANASGDPGLQVEAETGMGLLENLFDPPAAAARLTRAAKAGDVHNKDNFHAWPQFGLGMQAMLQGRLPDARRLFEQAAHKVIRTGSAEGQSGADLRLAELAWREGHWDEAQRLARRSMDVNIEAGAAVGYAGPGYVLALLDALRGETSRASQQARGAKEHCLQQGDIWNAVMNGWVEGLALLLRNDPAAAAVLTELDDLSSGYAIVFPYLADAVEALLVAGRHADAEERVRRLNSAAKTNSNHLWAQTTALRGRGLVLTAANDHEAAAKVLQEATQRARIMGAPLETARTLLAYGGALRRVRRRTEAGVALQECVEIFAALEAPDWGRKAGAELHRAVPGRGTGTLTPTEKAVAALAAKGHTNQDIARQLIVSVKTVEANLTKIYAKLGVRSRTGLAHLNLE